MAIKSNAEKQPLPENDTGATVNESAENELVETVETVDTGTGEISGGYKYDPNAVQIKKKLSLPLIKQKAGSFIDVYFLSKMFIGKEIETRKDIDASKKKGPATLANVINLQTGQAAQVILSAVQIGILNDSYPSNTYVDRSFRLANMGKLDGRDYNTCTIDELETPAGLSIDSIRSLVIMPE